MALQPVGPGTEFKATAKLYLRGVKKWEDLYKTSTTEFCFNESGQLIMTVCTRESGVLTPHILIEDSLLIKGERDYEFKTHSDEISTYITHFRIRFKDHNEQSQFRKFIEVNTSTDSAPPSPSESTSFDEEAAEEEKAIQPASIDRLYVSDESNMLKPVTASEIGETEWQLDQFEAQYSCPIAGGLMNDPVRVKGEHPSQVFEREAVQAWIDEKGGVYVGPCTGTKIESESVELEPAVELKKEIDVYKELRSKTKQALDQRFSKETAGAAITDKDDVQDTMTLEEIEIEINRLDEHEAWELADVYREALAWLKRYFLSETGRQNIANKLISAVENTSTSSMSEEEVNQAEEAASKVSQYTKEEAIKFIQQHTNDRKKSADAINERLLKKLKDNPDVNPDDVVNHLKKIDEIEQPIKKNVRSMMDRFIDATITASAVIAGAAAGAGIGFGLLFTHLIVLSICPVTSGIVICGLCGAAIGFGIWYVWKQRGWWKKKIKTV